MHLIEKSKIVTIGDNRYEIRRLAADKGSYMWHRLMSAMVKVRSSMTQELVDDPAATAVAVEQAQAMSPEQRMRGVCGIAFMQLSVEDFTYMQTTCMKVTSRFENDMPMPIMTDAGRWVADDIAFDPMLVTSLMTEVLVFNLISFLT
jgi:hypothetical protein